MSTACLEHAHGVPRSFREAPFARRSIFIGVDTASPQPGELTLTLPSAQPTLAAATEAVPTAAALAPALPPALLQELFLAADAASCSLTLSEFAAALDAVGARHNHNQPPEVRPTPAQQAAFYRALHLPDLALAHACALGREPAWQRLLALYRAPLTQAAIAIAGNATLGHEIAGSLYADLYGLATREGERRSPLTSYSGRGSLLGWLRSTLAQRHIDHHRRTHRETPLESVEGTEASAAPAPALTPIPAELARLTHAVALTLASLDAQDRFLLAAYFLDRQTLLQIARLLHVHEATVSRKLKRLTGDLRKQLLRNLQAGGLNKRAAEETLGTDPRDLELNLRALLQTTQPPPFSDSASPSDSARPSAPAATATQESAAK